MEILDKLLLSADSGFFTLKVLSMILVYNNIQLRKLQKSVDDIERNSGKLTEDALKELREEHHEIREKLTIITERLRK